MEDRVIYRLFDPLVWNKFQHAGVFVGTEVDIKDGFIHFSAHDQVIATAHKHYKDYPVLIMAAISTTDCKAELKWEVSRGGAKFPHLYRDLKLSDIKAHWELRSDGQGGYIWPNAFMK